MKNYLIYRIARLFGKYPFGKPNFEILPVNKAIKDNYPNFEFCSTTQLYRIKFEIQGCAKPYYIRFFYDSDFFFVAEIRKGEKKFYEFFPTANYWVGLPKDIERYIVKCIFKNYNNPKFL